MHFRHICSHRLVYACQCRNLVSWPAPKGLHLRINNAPSECKHSFHSLACHQVGQLRISSALETLLAPAILPRGSLQHRLLLGIKEASLRVPLRGSGPAAGPSPAASGFATYLLTYLDEDMLIGRAVGSGGSFVFTRQAEAAQRSQHGH